MVSDKTFSCVQENIMSHKIQVLLGVVVHRNGLDTSISSFVSWQVVKVLG